jgi:hypothetical protein
MELSDEYLQSLLAKINEKERTARKRAFLYSLIPIVFAIALIAFSGWQIKTANEELAAIREDFNKVSLELIETQNQLDSANQELLETQQELDETKSQLEQKQTELDDANQQLEEKQQQIIVSNETLEKVQQDLDDANIQLGGLEDLLTEVKKSLEQARTFNDYLFTIDELDLKILASDLPEEVGYILIDMVDMQNYVKWNVSGYSPDDGFDSPSYAAYMINRHFGTDLSNRLYELRIALTSRSQPEVGCLVFYESGYTMFYYESFSGTPFVMGMTPLGILALDPNFAPIIGYGCIP